MTQTDERPGRGRNGQTDEYAPRMLHNGMGARSQLRPLTTTERPRSRRWEEGGAAVVQCSTGLVQEHVHVSAERRQCPYTSQRLCCSTITFTTEHQGVQSRGGRHAGLRPYCSVTYLLSKIMLSCRHLQQLCLGLFACPAKRQIQVTGGVSVDHSRGLPPTSLQLHRGVCVLWWCAAGGLGVGRRGRREERAS